jgi:chlorobactene glucosyltransferase
LSGFWPWLELALLVFLALLLLIELTNLSFLRRLGTDALPRRFPRVSVLVPARNEELNIVPCLLSLLAQQYPDFEVIVLDDLSTDRTRALAADLARRENRLRVVDGHPTPSGWLGKHWACQQLAGAAGGELLLFTDADTRHHPRALRAAVAALVAEGADLLSAVPRQEAVTWSERLVLTVLPWSILAFLPLGIAFRVRHPALSAALGQYMLFRRAAYEQVGGHASVRQDVVDDIALARRIKAEGLCWRLLDGVRHIRCRMYRNWGELREGFSKNLWAAFGYRFGLFLLVLLWLGIVFWEPLLALAGSAAGLELPPVAAHLAIAGVGLSLVLWFISNLRFRFPLYLSLLYPISILLVQVLALRSLLVVLGARATWKGRPVQRPPR